MSLSPNRSLLFLFIFSLIIALTGCSGSGTTPVVPDNNNPDSDRNGFGSLTDLGAPDSDEFLDNYWKGTVKLRGLTWIADIAEDGDIHRAIGEGITIDGSIEQFVDSNPGVFQISSDDLWLMKDQRHGKVRYVIYRQAYNGIPILDSRVDFRFGVGDKLIMVGADVFPEISDVPSATINRSGAESIARFEHEGDISYIELYIVQLSDKSFTPAWQILIGEWEMIISATTGEVLYEESLVDEFDFDGEVNGEVNDVNPFGTTSILDLGNTRIRFQDVGNYDIYADQTGEYHYSTSDYTELTTNVQLLGKWVNVNNDNGPDADITRTTFEGVPETFLFDDDNTDTTETNVYYWADISHTYVKNIEPGFTGMDIVVTALVNQNPWCNATASGNTINFFLPASGCLNLGEIADVIVHEYGHIVTRKQYSPNNAPPSSMREGFSDILGNTVTDQALIGYNYMGVGTHIRNSDNNIWWPTNNCNGGGHCLGEILAGAQWDLYQLLGSAKADELWWFAKYGEPQTFPEFATELVVYDDDDGDLSNGTPNYTEIYIAYEDIHGIPVPDAPDYLDLSVSVDPDTDPIEISRATGGSFGFDVTLTNNMPINANFDAWVDILRPNGQWYGPVVPPTHYIGIPVNLTFIGNKELTTHITQNIPAGLPLGAVYEYHVRVGNWVDASTQTVIDEDILLINVVP